jgi:nucleoside-diphosphate-sugar epimerase
MNVLITGVLGMVGSHMLDFLLEKPTIKIYGFCRWNESMDNIEHLTDIINKKEKINLW